MKATLWIGKTVMVFDPRLWDKNGGDSKTDSFFREAIVMKIHDEVLLGRAVRPYSKVVVDVKFKYDGVISRCHFADGIKECPFSIVQPSKPTKKKAKSK